ncbi:MAG: polysaccharide biosynthesis protein [Verrucomicrobia bacterium]|jgi:FlaA1/EpsC-like NDP-sugar epimerase|nr:polysaccharide biosynthesis protein [Verrucomicrobiota bacterium]
MNINGKSILVTGGTGSFGKHFIKTILERWPQVKRLIVFSRDEQKGLFEQNNWASPHWEDLQ